MPARVERVTDAVAFHGEGPVWSERWGGLRWVDMLAGDVLSLAADGSVERRHVGSVAAALRPRRGGGAVIAVERGFVVEEPGGALTALPDVFDTADVRLNEGACGPGGSFYCGTMAYDQREGAGRLYRLDAERSVTVMLDGVTISNGLDWSPDGTRAYYVDTPTREISLLDGDLTARRPFARVDGLPDGLTVDAEGGVWVAIYDGGCVRRFAPDGTLDAEVSLPTPNVTACTFGGPGLDRLFITTTREAGAPDPAGSLFVADVGVAGVAVREWAG